MTRVRGLILPWNTPGKATVNRANREVSAPPGSISSPPDKSWVKLYFGHRKPDGTGISVGYLEELRVADRGLEGTFVMGSSKVAQEALQAIRDKTDDGLSVELEPLTMQPNGREIEHGRLDGVALVPRPAFLSARVEEIQEAG